MEVRTGGLRWAMRVPRLVERGDGPCLVARCLSSQFMFCAGFSIVRLASGPTGVGCPHHTAVPQSCGGGQGGGVG